MGDFGFRNDIWMQNENFLKKESEKYGNLFLNQKSNKYWIRQSNTPFESEATALNAVILNIHQSKFTSVFWHLHIEHYTPCVFEQYTIILTQSFDTKDNSNNISTYCYLSITSIDKYQWDLVNFCDFSWIFDRYTQWPCVNDFPKIR